MKKRNADLVPTPKVAAAGIAGSVTILVVYVAGLFGLDVPPEVASAFTAILSFAAGYVTDA